MRDVLDRVLSYADSLDTAIELSEALGWTVYLVDGPQRKGGSFFVMLRGRPGPVLLHHAVPDVVTQERYTNATFHSLYGAVLLALVRGLAWERQASVDAAAFIEHSKPKPKKAA